MCNDQIKTWCGNFSNGETGVCHISFAVLAKYLM